MWGFFPLGRRWWTSRSSLGQAGFTALIGKCVSHEVDLTPLRSHSAVLRWRFFRVARHSGLGRIERRALRFDGDGAKLLVRPNPGCATPRTMGPLPWYEVCYPRCPGHKCRTAAVEFAVSSGGPGQLTPEPKPFPAPAIRSNARIARQTGCENIREGIFNQAR